jgi:hypothetical protein
VLVNQGAAGWRDVDVHGCHGQLQILAFVGCILAWDKLEETHA